MKLAVSTWLWESPFQTESISLFPKIKAFGFDAVEIPIEDPEIIDAKVVDQALKDHGLGVIVCGAFGPARDLTHEDPNVHRNCFDYINKCFDFCNIWGASFLAGPMYSAVGKTRMLPPDEREKDWKLAVHNLRTVCKMAKTHALQVALEPLNRFESDLINTAEDVVRLVQDIDHPAAKILLDGFHMTIEERDLEQAINSSGRHLIHVQVSENHRGIPGTGLTNWQAIKKGLENIQYKGTVSIESFTPEIKELAGAVCIWKNLAPNQDQFALEGFQFLNRLFNG